MPYEFYSRFVFSLYKTVKTKKTTQGNILCKEHLCLLDKYVSIMVLWPKNERCFYAFLQI